MPRYYGKISKVEFPRGVILKSHWSKWTVPGNSPNDWKWTAMNLTWFFKRFKVDGVWNPKVDDSKNERLKKRTIQKRLKMDGPKSWRSIEDRLAGPAFKSSLPSIFARPIEIGLEQVEMSNVTNVENWPFSSYLNRKYSMIIVSRWCEIGIWI